MWSHTLSSYLQPPTPRLLEHNLKHSMHTFLLPSPSAFLATHPPLSNFMILRTIWAVRILTALTNSWQQVQGGAPESEWEGGRGKKAWREKGKSCRADNGALMTKGRPTHLSEDRRGKPAGAGGVWGAVEGVGRKENTTSWPWSSGKAPNQLQV